MKPKYSAPSENDYQFLASRWISISNLVKDEYGYDLNQSEEDLSFLQQTLDDDVIQRSQEALESLGVGLGRVMARNIDSTDWWRVEDEYGSNLCLRLGETTLQINPISMISNRVARGEKVDIPALYHGIRDRILEVINQAQ